MTDTPKARRTDGTEYVPTHPQFIGNGFMRSCCKCGQFKAQREGWKKLKGLSLWRCPECVK
jgi:hypothetical protein